MNYRFKQAIKEELARLETMHVASHTAPTPSFPSKDYARGATHRTMNLSLLERLYLSWKPLYLSFL